MTTSVAQFKAATDAALAPGDAVVIRGGPFKGFTGTFEQQMRDADQVSILLQGTIYQAHVVVDRDMIEKGSEAPS